MVDTANTDHCEYQSLRIPTIELKFIFIYFENNVNLLKASEFAHYITCLFSELSSYWIKHIDIKNLPIQINRN